MTEPVYGDAVPSDAVIRDLAADPDLDVRGRVAESGWPLPVDVIEAMAADPAVYVRGALAGTARDLPERIIRTLAADEHWSIRNILAGSTHRLPDDVIAALAVDPVVSVRSALADTAARPLPDAVTRVLAKDPVANVRWALAASDRTLPDDVIVLLVTDPDPHVVRPAMMRRLGIGWNDTPDWDALHAATASNPQARIMIAGMTPDTALLARIAAREPVVHARVAAAGNPAATDHILSLLADDPDSVVRAAVQARVVFAAQSGGNG